MQLTSTRFGTVDVPDDAIVEFPSGLVGIGGSRYALLARDNEDSFLWLQSLEDADLALPVVNPWDFFPGYELELTKTDAERVGEADPEETALYVTVRAADTDRGFSANLRAPILIAGRIGHQVINQAQDAPVRAPLAA
ncbi:MAG: flagellar assembly protein FliW [Solirubrobacteraceae bacterium]